MSTVVDVNECEDESKERDGVLNCVNLMFHAMMFIELADLIRFKRINRVAAIAVEQTIEARKEIDVLSVPDCFSSRLVLQCSNLEKLDLNTILAGKGDLEAYEFAERLAICCPKLSDFGVVEAENIKYLVRYVTTLRSPFMASELSVQWNLTEENINNMVLLMEVSESLFRLLDHSQQQEKAIIKICFDMNACELEGSIYRTRLYKNQRALLKNTLRQLCLMHSKVTLTGHAVRLASKYFKYDYTDITELVLDSGTCDLSERKVESLVAKYAVNVDKLCIRAHISSFKFFKQLINLKSIELLSYERKNTSSEELEAMFEDFFAARGPELREFTLVTPNIDLRFVQSMPTSI